MNLEQIEDIEAILAEERERITNINREIYENSEHKIFALGEWVTDGSTIGTVQRLIDKGYMNVDIKNNNGGLLTNTKVNNFKILEEDVLEYYIREHEISLSLTGEDIEAFFMSYIAIKGMNPSKSKDKLIKALESVRIESE